MCSLIKKIFCVFFLTLSTLGYTQAAPGKQSFRPKKSSSKPSLSTKKQAVRTPNKRKSNKAIIYYFLFPVIATTFCVILFTVFYTEKQEEPPPAPDNPRPPSNLTNQEEKEEKVEIETKDARAPNNPPNEKEPTPAPNNSPPPSNLTNQEEKEEEEKVEIETKDARDANNPSGEKEPTPAPAVSLSSSQSNEVSDSHIADPPQDQTVAPSTPPPPQSPKLRGKALKIQFAQLEGDAFNEFINQLDQEQALDLIPFSIQFDASIEPEHMSRVLDRLGENPADDDYVAKALQAKATNLLQRFVEKNLFDIDEKISNILFKHFEEVGATIDLEAIKAIMKNIQYIFDHVLDVYLSREEEAYKERLQAIFNIPHSLQWTLWRKVMTCGRTASWTRDRTIRGKEISERIYPVIFLLEKGADITHAKIDGAPFQTFIDAPENQDNSMVKKVHAFFVQKAFQALNLHQDAEVHAFLNSLDATKASYLIPLLLEDEEIKHRYMVPIVNRLDQNAESDHYVQRALRLTITDLIELFIAKNFFKVDDTMWELLSNLFDTPKRHINFEKDLNYMMDDILDLYHKSGEIDRLQAIFNKRNSFQTNLLGQAIQLGAKYQKPPYTDIYKKLLEKGADLTKTTIQGDNLQKYIQAEKNKDDPFLQKVKTFLEAQPTQQEAEEKNDQA